MQHVNFSEALEVLRRGQILVYPTETLYGLGVDSSQEDAIQKVYRLKGRDPSKPISLLVSGLDQIKPLVSELNPKVLKLIEKYFPGPLTLVLPASPQVSPVLLGGSDWIGIRQSSHPLAQGLVQNLGRPITTTSANLSGQGGGESFKKIEEDLGQTQEVFALTAGELVPSPGSTVIRMRDGKAELLREGAIRFSEILATLQD